MHWYRASAWDCHTMKHLKDNLPIFPDDPALARNSYPILVVMLFPALQNKFYLMKKILESEHKPLNVSLRKIKPGQVPTPGPPIPKMEGLKLSFLEPEAPSIQRTEHHIKQGPVKSSKKFKFTF